MHPSPHVILLKNPSDTERLGWLLAETARAGQCILLEGDIGAGKTFLARTIIQRLLQKAGAYEDVPSPTFTLVQTYETGSFETWHADLYRLSTPDEIVELGLEDAFISSFCLIEWPDRLGELTPEHAITISLKMDDRPEHRICTIANTPPALSVVLDGFEKDRANAV